MDQQLLHITPVLPSADIPRDVLWYEEILGFQPVFHDGRYAVLQRNRHFLHL
ncbi:catechol 2,3-dioxygenase-like lactoylglutathione lyase family enzyme [Lewinella marina]|uniref:hypothetical protein n=1 Tax=Neolewinella marina TaxID=438751 RepID=UPI00169D2347|nr:hypothetical protein [Neolewinella marina]NJB86554.1 catechol 2,3-dioxygenase-like lactoylglutathione lyase family enzyme [Neolewinella marina]